MVLVPHLTPMFGGGTVWFREDGDRRVVFCLSSVALGVIGKAA
ncbi:MAG: hypothetical protein SFV15_16215 [Polyangiaceae bacterium]|nr:hypothetical protein [Polyangiaceae bacterium]